MEYESVTSVMAHTKLAGQSRIRPNIRCVTGSVTSASPTAERERRSEPAGRAHRLGSGYLMGFAVPAGGGGALGTAIWGACGHAGGPHGWRATAG